MSILYSTFDNEKPEVNQLKNIISEEVLVLLEQGKISLKLHRYSGGVYQVSHSADGFCYNQYQKIGQNFNEKSVFSSFSEVKNRQFLLHDVEYTLATNPELLQIQWFSEQEQQKYYKNLLHVTLLTLPIHSVLVITENQSIRLLGGFGSDFDSEVIPTSLSIIDIITFLYQGSSKNLYRTDLDDSQYTLLVSLCREYNHLKFNTPYINSKLTKEGIAIEIFKVLKHPTTIFTQFKGELLSDRIH